MAESRVDDLEHDMELDVDLDIEERYESLKSDAQALAREVDELQRRLDAVVIGKPETDIAKAIDGALYLVMFAHLFGGIPETLHFRSISDGDWFWSKYPPNEGGPLYGKSNTVLWFAEIRAVTIAEGRDNG